LGPKEILEGDNIIIFPGSRVPFIVWKTHATPESIVEINQNNNFEITITHKVSNYILVRDYYVHRAINGAIMNNRDFE